MDRNEEVKCGATFKEYCQFPKCDCDRVDPLLDRSCALFDGSCDCPAPALYNCKRYTQALIL